MTVGIYLLRFNGTKKVYVGQSLNIERRYGIHCTSLKRNTSSRKLQEAYNSYGLPYYEILTECCKEELNYEEEQAIRIFNSDIEGFNTMSKYGHSSTLQGEKCGNAKYSNEAIYEVFFYLTKCTDLTHKEISEITGISRGVISDISSCKGYLWLKELYPIDYLILEELKETRRKLRGTINSKQIEYPSILSPGGIEYKVCSIRGFAREHSINPHALGRVLRRQALSTGGWKLK